MVSAKNAMFMFTIIAPFAICFGTVYRVGDASGWHPMFDYQKWASSKKFCVADTIRFEYNAIFHNVKEVTEPNYRACNATNPIATYYTGNDSFTLKQPGHRYFLCGFPNHCKYGQKVDIYVHEVSSPSPAPANSLPLPPSPAAENPATSSVRTNSASSIHISIVQIAIKSVAMVVLAYFV
ncbi:Phytocyanin domain - like 3 [Theobroma cacao]|uniref:Mavicyanin n=1 Tax=Theobroma cacao TaxID=3641 RepID=A0AB32VMJ0_THECC|nr:PREDICTED: mavicyanin [Theobroma cacao]WRX07794.1 Phytocyanin domain - like 3 [Theobroma cacao]